MLESLIYGAATHTGLVRANNEDHYAIMSHEGNFPYALILADGMGGHRRGELASQIAVEYVKERFISRISEKPADRGILADYWPIFLKRQTSKFISVHWKMKKTGAWARP